MASTPAFVATPVIGLVSIATANTNLDGTGTIGTVVTGATNGTRIDAVQIKAIVTTTAGMVRLYLHDGTNYFLIAEVIVPAITKSATVPAFETTWVPPVPIVLPNSYSLRASTEKAETFKVAALGGNL